MPLLIRSRVGTVLVGGRSRCIAGADAVARVAGQMLSARAAGLRKRQVETVIA